MKKIIVAFSSSSRIQKLKKIMKQVYSSGNNNIPEIIKFNLNKDLIPERVERVEIEIKKIIGSDLTINIPKTSLTFLTAGQPFNIVDASCDLSARYIVLPWNIGTATGKEELKNIISKISSSVNSLKYTVYVNDNVHSGDDNISQAELNLSASSFEDNTEELFIRIQELENRVRQLDRDLVDAKAEAARHQGIAAQKDVQINSLNNQVTNLYSQISNLNSQTNNLNTQLSQKQNHINSLNTQIGSLQSTNYTQSMQLASFTGGRNLVEIERNADRHRIYRLTNYTGKILILLLQNYPGGIGTENVPRDPIQLLRFHVEFEKAN